MLWTSLAAIVFPTKFKPQVGAKHRCVYKCIWTAGAPCFGWSKWPCILHSQGTLYSVDFILNWKYIHDQKPLHHSCSKSDCQWTWTFHILFTTTDFVFSNFSVLLFLHDQFIKTPCPIKIWYPGHFSYEMLKKCATLVTNEVLTNKSHMKSSFGQGEKNWFILTDISTNWHLQYPNRPKALLPFQYLMGCSCKKSAVKKSTDAHINLRLLKIFFF